VYRREGVFAHVDERDADREGERQVLGERCDTGVDGDASGRQIDLDAAVTRRHPDGLHLVLANVERALVARADQVDAVPHPTGGARLAFSAHTHSPISSISCWYKAMVIKR